MSAEAYDATLRLGTLISVLATVCAIGLALVGDVSKWSLAISVLLIGSIASWIQSGVFTRTADGAH